MSRFLLRTFLCCLVVPSAIVAQDVRSNVRALVQTSPFPAPKASDSTFVVDDGAGLDTGCTYRSGGPLRITLPIKRVLGNVAMLKAKGLVPSTISIQFPAYDVDSPERDLVSFNGNVVPGTYLTGLNDKWVMQRFDIPVEWIQFADDPGDKGTAIAKSNLLQIDIDTASGSYENWCTAVDWVALTVNAPLPYMGAHGIFSKSKVWNPLWVPQLGALGIPATGGPDMGRLDSIQNNSVKIADAVAAAKLRFGVSRINIMAHSKGGLDSRDFVEGDSSVDHLIQLGTPNAGSPLADVAQGIAGNVLGLPLTVLVNAFATPAGYQLTTPYMNLYNRFHGFNAKTDYTAIAGVYTPGSFFSDTMNNLLVSIVGDGDTIVPETSVHTLSYTKNLTQPSSYPDDGATHTKLESYQPVFNLALPDIETPARDLSQAIRVGQPVSTLPQNRSLKALATGVSANGLQRTGSFVGSLTVGQSQSFSVPVDAATVAAFTLLYASGTLNLSLIDPNGVVYDANSVTGNPAIGHQQTAIPGGFAETFSFQGNVPTGLWQARVTASDAPSSVDFSVNAWLQGSSITMQTTMLTPSVSLGSPIRLQAQLANGSSPILGATVQSRFRIPGGGTGTLVTLHDDGAAPDQVANDGIYTGSFTPTQAANYNVTTGAAGAATLPFSRESYDLVSVAQTTSTIGMGITDLGRDLNGNGLYDQLILHVPLRLGASIHYRLAGTLQDSAGNTLSSSTLITTNASYAELVFDGATINQRGINGPYTLTSLKLAEEDGMAILPLQETTPNYKTVAYRYTQFEGQAFSLNAAGNSAVGVDTNVNGKYDLLRVSIGVNVQNAGYYTWSARLRDSTGKEIGLVSNAGSLTQGATSVRLDFDGTRIGQNGVNGPYTVTDFLLYSSQTLSAINVFTTPAFPASSFEGYTAPAGPPVLAGALGTLSNPGNGTRQIPLIITNNGTGGGQNIVINQIVFRVLSGSGTIGLASPGLPIAVGTLAPGQSSTTTLLVNVPNTVTRFSLTETGSVSDINGKGYAFSIAQSAILTR